MLQYLFPRLMGQYKEGGLIVGKFLVSNSGATLTPVAGDCHQKLTASGDTGVYVVTLAGGARHITVVGQPYATLPDKDDPADARQVFVDQETGINAGAGTIPLIVMDLGVDTDAGGADTDAVAIADLVDGSVLVVALYVDK